MACQLICESLIIYCDKYLPKKAEEKSEEKAIEHGDSKPLTKNNLDDDDPYAMLKKGKKKGKGGGGAAPGAAAPAAKVKSMKLVHAPEDFALWEKLELKAPSTSDDCVGLHAALLEKREWLKTAPPKKKKEKEVKEPKEDKPSSSEKKGRDKAGAKAGPAAEAAESNGSSAKAKAAATPELIQVVATSDSQVAIRLML